jgi:hypothetical protein
MAPELLTMENVALLPHLRSARGSKGGQGMRAGESQTVFRASGS